MSQMYNFATRVNFLDCKLGILTHTSAELWIPAMLVNI